ncbi:MAG: CBS domain-containing protein [Candidatus Methanoperedens sp.]|jgi:CBS domain-containing protein|nr:CBS domain-containing protein [Candidatus Methanoperedens sp.]PKL54615.1 MAG: histidine kinase [Candidatus Methanoperedenaceae archaeon HGW-Methanoperedenaceae-1]
MKIGNKLLRDVMTRGVVTVSMDVTVKHVAVMLTEQGLSAIVVISPDGEAVGVISDMDILKVIGKDGWENMAVETIMTTHLETVRPASTLNEAAKIMREKHIHRLLVFSEHGVGASQRPIGVLSASDIVKEAAKD